jgi:hypothetical protein
MDGLSAMASNRRQKPHAKVSHTPLTLGHTHPHQIQYASCFARGVLALQKKTMVVGSSSLRKSAGDGP